MSYFIFIGDMLVMAFMIAVVIWVSMKSNKKSIERATKIPLEDEHHGS